MDNKQERNAAIADAVRAGTILQEIAARHGLSTERARQIAKEAGVTSVRGRTQEDTVQAAIALFKRGMPLTHAAEAVGIAPRTLSRRLVAMGLYTVEKPQHFVWDAHSDEILRRFYNSYPGAVRALAEKLGTTRNSIIGRAHRLGLQRPKP